MKTRPAMGGFFYFEGGLGRGDESLSAKSILQLSLSIGMIRRRSG